MGLGVVGSTLNINTRLLHPSYLALEGFWAEGRMSGPSEHRCKHCQEQLPVEDSDLADQPECEETGREGGLAGWLVVASVL